MEELEIPHALQQPNAGEVVHISEIKHWRGGSLTTWNTGEVSPRGSYHNLEANPSLEMALLSHPTNLKLHPTSKGKVLQGTRSTFTEQDNV